MKNPFRKSRPMTVWEKVGAAVVAAVLLIVVFRIIDYLTTSLHSHFR